MRLGGHSKINADAALAVPDSGATPRSPHNSAWSRRNSPPASHCWRLAQQRRRRVQGLRPLCNQRTDVVVAEVGKAFPNKAIKYLVDTHNHFDHLGGVRGFEGALRGHL
jgi:Metallo-beta-lactamase superfamily